MRRPAQIILHRPLISNIFISTDAMRLRSVADPRGGGSGGSGPPPPEIPGKKFLHMEK